MHQTNGHHHKKREEKNIFIYNLNSLFWLVIALSNGNISYVESLHKVKVVLMFLIAEK